MKSGSELIPSHVPDDITIVLVHLLISGQVLFMAFEIIGGSIARSLGAGWWDSGLFYLHPL